GWGAAAAARGVADAASVRARLRQSSPAVTPVLDSDAVLAGCGARPAHTLATSAPGFAHRSLQSADLGGSRDRRFVVARFEHRADQPFAPASTAVDLDVARIGSGDSGGRAGDGVLAARVPQPASTAPESSTGVTAGEDCLSAARSEEHTSELQSR